MLLGLYSRKLLHVVEANAQWRWFPVISVWQYWGWKNVYELLKPVCLLSYVWNGFLKLN